MGPGHRNLPTSRKKRETWGTRHPVRNMGHPVEIWVPGSISYLSLAGALPTGHRAVRPPL